MLQSGNRAILSSAVGAEYCKLMQNIHSIDDFRGSHNIAKTQTGHSVSLGEAVEHDGAVLKLLKGGEHGVLFASIGQVGIKLVADDNQIVVGCPVADSLDLLLADNSAGRIVRIAQHNSLGFGVTAASNASMVGTKLFSR